MNQLPVEPKTDNTLANRPQLFLVIRVTSLSEGVYTIQHLSERHGGDYLAWNAQGKVRSCSDYSYR